MTDGVAPILPGRLAQVHAVVVEDRHRDVEIHLYSTASAAEVVALRFVTDRWSWPAGEAVDRQELDDDMRAAGWTYYSEYSTEGDSVRIQTLEVR